MFHRGEAWRFAAPTSGGVKAGVSDGAIYAPMPGRIAVLNVKPGDSVKRGQVLVVLEAMKMEHVLVAPVDGVVAEVLINVHQQVSEGAMLVRAK